MINQVDCTGTNLNTGVYGCEVNWQTIVGTLFSPSPLEFDASDTAALLTAIKAAILNDTSSQRIYPLQNIDGATANNEDTVTQSTTYGTKLFVRNGKYDITYTYHTGGIGLSNALFGNKTMYFLGIDNQGRLVGTKSTKAGYIKMIPTTYYEGKPAGLNLGAEAMSFSVNVQWSSDLTNTGVAVVDFKNFGGLAALAGLTGLVNINLSLAATRAANVFQVKTLAGFGNTDIYTNYKTVLASVNAWVAKNKATGALITITSVAANDNLSAYTVTLDTTDPDYTATTNGVLLSLVGPTELDALNVSGFESVKLAA